jgi:hypothetical protein
MSYIVADRVKESSTIVGTGTISLLGAAVGFRTFASQMSVGDTCSYVIANTTGSEWEVGIATYSSANTLTRTTVQSSTNANAVVNFSAGMKDVFISPTAQSVIDYNPITHQISNTNSIVASPVASGVGNSLTITAGNGVGVGAGGNIVLAPGSQGSSGGDGKVIINNDANINELTIGKGIGQGYDSTAFGVEALNTSSYGGSNTALGYHTLKNTTGGSANTAIGSYALEFNNSGYYGTAIGAYALYVNTGGSQNTAVGAECLGSVTTGNNNVAIGAQAGANLVNGSNNILIGKTVYSPATSTSNFMTIGNLIFASGGFGTYNDIGTGNVGIGQASPTAKLHVKGSSSSTKGVIVQGASSQTANLQEWQNSDGTVVASIGNDGSIWTSGTNTVPLKPINYTYTGTLDVPPIIILSTPTPNQSGSSIDDYSGKWASTIVLSASNQSLTSISFTDLQGIVNAFNPNSINALTSMSFPALTTVGSSFTPNNMFALTSLSLPALTTVGNSFAPNSMTALTSLNLPALTTVGGAFGPNLMAALTSLSVPALTAVVASFSPYSMAALTSLSVPALTAVGTSFNPSIMGALTSLSAPALNTIGTNFQPNTMAALTSMNFQALISIGTASSGNFNPYGIGALTSMSFPALTTVVGNFNPGNMAALTSITIPSMVRIGTGITSGSVIQFTTGLGALTTFQLPSTLLQIGNGGGNVVITSAALNQASVDSILVRLAALDGTNGTTLFSTRTVTITGTSSTPSATGLAAKATLVARGCTVTTN